MTHAAGSGRVTRDHAGPDIWCEDLVRIYSGAGSEVQALQGLNLVVEPGEVVALVGASGSGKSTLLGILSGLDRPTGGRARVAGHDLTAMRPRQRVEFRRHSVGFVWQQTSHNLVPFLSVVENVAVPLMLTGRRDPQVRAEEMLDLLGVREFARSRPGELSGGQQQRVAVAPALANGPTVLLADEPTGELDDDSSAEVLGALREVAGRTGTTVLIVTHDPTVSSHVERTIQIRDGRTSSEVVRRFGADGRAGLVEEYTVIDRAGRIQLPKAQVEALGLRDRVRLRQSRDHVGVWPAEPGPGREGLRDA